MPCWCGHLNRPVLHLLARSMRHFNGGIEPKIFDAGLPEVLGLTNFVRLLPNRRETLAQRQQAGQPQRMGVRFVCHGKNGGGQHRVNCSECRIGNRRRTKCNNGKMLMFRVVVLLRQLLSGAAIQGGICEQSIVGSLAAVSKTQCWDLQSFPGDVSNNGFYIMRRLSGTKTPGAGSHRPANPIATASSRT